MSGPLDRIVLVGPSRDILGASMKRMGIPPFPLERKGVVLLGAGRDELDRIRGMAGTPWAVMPGYTVPQPDLSNIHANLRHGPRDFYEILALHLAWKIWHDC